MFPIVSEEIFLFLLIMYFVSAPQSNTNYSTYDASAYNTTPMYVTPQAQTVSAITGTGNKTSNTWKGYKNGSITTSNTGISS